jgi:hypothetical protein
MSTAFPPYQLDGLPLSDTNRLKMLLEDENLETTHFEFRAPAPRLISLVAHEGEAPCAIEVCQEVAAVRSEIEVKASGRSSPALIHEEPDGRLHEVPGSKVIEAGIPQLMRKQA